MLNRVFGYPTIDQDIKQLILKNALVGNVYRVQSLMTENKISYTDTSLVDEWNQNLLHIAVRTKNYCFDKALVREKVNKSHKNIFGETPFDIATKNQDVAMMEILFNYVGQIEEFKSENDRLKARMADTNTRFLESQNNNKMLIAANKD